MSRVERDAEVTIGVLIYRGLRWLDWFIDGLESSRQETRYRICVVSNDGTDEVRSDPRITIDWQNDDPNEHYLARVYRAWGECVLNAPTQWVILANSDMRFSDYAVDELVAEKRRNPRSLPCSLLIENGRIRSGMPEFVRDLGTHPDNFNVAEFTRMSDLLRQRGKTQDGRLFQPILFDRQEYSDFGGYPHGNIDGVSGDKILFDRYIKSGFKWITCLGSIVGHCQEGEMRDA